jgi:lipopolysaccharide/colanic/teichoic acid biosynthesis glycosyltransferase
MSRRLFDLVVSGMLLLLMAPFLILVAAAVSLYDFRSPLYVSERVGKGGRPFRIVKLRSMVVNADKTGVTSTSAIDSRITPVGRYVRALKLDELTQFWNVFKGDMSLVGPRPNVASDVALYTESERRLLTVRPGITDFASIVFADEGEILKAHKDANKAYDQLIRPWKNRLALFYLDNSDLLLDIKLILFTALAVISRKRALHAVVSELQNLNAPEELVQVARRIEPLQPSLPPGWETGR